MQAEEIKPEAASCNISRSISEKKDFEILTIKNKNFNQRLNNIGFNNRKLKYNLFITNGTKPSAGYSLKFDKIIKNKNKFKIYLIETKPNKMSANAAVLIYPFCLLKVDNLDQIEVIIK
ncbi:protease complex subunit PrcB family protein [Candidatus Pelagibacter sp.]|nr:protease complex subunit PrcB family protein [Candidatus Pelagibacter sp.]